MEQNKKIDAWKIVLISLAVSAVVAVGVVFIVKLIKKKKALKEMLIEWDDEEAFEKCMNGHHDGDILVVSTAE